MNGTLVKALVALLAVCLLFYRLALSYCRRRTVPSLLPLVGAACLFVVVIAHISEALGLFPSMHWGSKHSAGHYLDLWSAIVGVTLLAVGYLLQALRKHRAK
jgi:hypothetical protein